MIIRNIRATNVLKYTELSLQDLPAAGLIAISGPNESGKSTVGETVCFALFGRTFSLSQQDLQKVIRWGENDCSVSVEFEINGQSYELSRYLDRDGNHSARLSRDGEGEPMVRGVDNVAAKLFELLGYEFNEFIESFYLAQREITTPHPHSHAVKLMAGVAPMEQVSADFVDEIADFEEKLGEIQAEVDAAEQELEELDVTEGQLIQLEDRRTALDHRLADNRRQAEELEGATASYLERIPEIEAAESGRRSASTLRTWSLLLALLCVGAWVLLTQATQLSLSQQLLGLLEESIPNWREAYVRYIGYTAIGFGALALVLWIRASGKRRKVEELSSEAARLTEVLSQVREMPGDEAGQGRDAKSPVPQPGRVDHPVQLEFNTLKEQLAKGEATTRDVNAYVDQERDWLQDLIERQSVSLAELDQEVEEETARVQQVAKLHEVLDGLRGKQGDLGERIVQRQRAIDLLAGASRQLSRQFNRDVKDLVGQTLPLFTAGRYEHLKIDEDLTVRAFSSEKRDFMDLDEVSSGTQRQIMLALRLALSEKLLNRAVKGRQFAFLDEPFAFFDEARTRAAIEALNAFRGDISQIWIVAQSFPEDADVQFALRINCHRDSDTLNAGA